VQGTLTVAGPADVPSFLEAHGIVATLTPSQATAGQGTAAQYVVQLINIGSTDDTFGLAVTGLPAGVTASFGATTIDVPPGASNFRDVALTLTSSTGTAPGNIPFAVSATSTTLASVAGSAAGTLTVLGGGVSVSLNATSGAPGTTFMLTVTNTGATQDTFSLALGGPAAIVASLGTNSVTLAAGASQVVPIATSAVDFATQGSLNLTVTATSATNAAIRAATSASLTIPSTRGLTAEFQNAVQVIPMPGTSSFLLMVNNTGNTQDRYTATISSASGPVSANLTGLDGRPTQSIPTFILPGLSSGALVLNTDLSATGTGMVTVNVQSLSSPSETASAIAMVSTSTPTPTPTLTPTPNPIPTPTPTTPSPSPRLTPSPFSTSPVTITGLEVEKVKLAHKRHAKKALMFFVQFSGALDAAAAQELAAYTVLAGKTRKVHRIKQVIYKKPLPLTEAVYNTSADSVILVPRGQRTLPKLERLQVNVSILTDPMGREINNGKNFTATVTKAGLIVSTDGVATAARPAAAAVDAVFEQEVSLVVRGARQGP
jgi:hypothetical protein